MKTLLPLPSFPSGLDASAARSLSLIFILEELYCSLSLLETFSGKEDLSIDKLCFYCDILLQASKVEKHSIVKELQTMNLFLAQRKFQSIAIEKLDPTYICSLFKDHLSSFFSALRPFLQEARTDENVLMYLIEHAERFNRHFGSHTIENLLQCFFPGGHSHLRAILYEGFTRRGFTSFLSEKEPLIEALDWESP